LLFPIDWPEPFGLVMIEAMACGTPVIAFRCGSVPEVVDDKVSGFIVDTMDEAVAAVERIVTLDRAAVRAQFESRFTVERMAKNYLEIYRKLLSTHSQPRKLNGQQTLRRSGAHPVDIARYAISRSCGSARGREARKEEMSVAGPRPALQTPHAGQAHVEDRSKDRGGLAF
jgi:hypothetical protein